jgi:hypothetical protein
VVEPVYLSMEPCAGTGIAKCGALCSGASVAENGTISKCTLFVSQLLQPHCIDCIHPHITDLMCCHEPVQSNKNVSTKLFLIPLRISLI